MTTINLIMGDYTPLEAKEILLKMVETKINFHKLRNLSAHVHFGKADADSEARIGELKEAGAQIIALVQKAIDDKTMIEIGSTIDIAFKVKAQPEAYVQGQEVAGSYQA
ncbi:hypothetical protein [Pontibacter pamirensis]|uniref:hypothetical protein n=1 Tax=Pontibacter pamirensis TaxID=2562824 RepID=UPI001389DB8C|nr:hypothetical protein [Pontibacter pamirensis]